jgi:uncharacterized membrane protein (GlpM family)
MALPLTLKRYQKPYMLGECISWLMLLQTTWYLSSKFRYENALMLDRVMLELAAV